MNFYRLEKTNYFKIYSIAVIRSLAIALLLTIGCMLLLGYKFMIVSSGSMEPVLPTGSLIIVTPCEYDDLKLNDIVTMDANGINLTHRIVGKMDSENNIVLPDDPNYENAYWYTKGDNSDTIDGIIRRRVIGTVDERHCSAFLGEVVRFVKTNYISVLIFIIGIILIIECYFWIKGKLKPNDIEYYDDEDEEEA